MPRRLDYAAYLEHLADDSARFAHVLRRTPYDTAVPTCPDWTAADLLFHLAEVQAFWARIVGRRLTSGEDAEELVTIRPEADERAAGTVRRVDPGPAGGASSDPARHRGVELGG